MTRLYEVLVESGDPKLLAFALLLAFAAAWTARALLPSSRAAPRRAAVAGSAVVLGFGTWLIHGLVVLSLFPGLEPFGDPATAFEGVALASGGALLAVMAAVRRRPGYRDTLLAGALLAAATACTVFLGLSSLTRPYRLAYELAPVTGTVLLAAVLGGLGLAGAARRRALPQRLAATLCLALALLVPALAGLGSILSFSDWMAEAEKPASLATEPVLVVLAASGLVLLALVVAGSVADHHAALQAERESERLRQLADSAMEGIAIHRSGHIIDANSAFCALLGAPLEQVRGRRVRDLFSEPTELAEAAEARETALLAEGGAVPVEVLARAITYRDESAQVLAVRDIRERRAAEERIRHLALHDALTGLPNRARLHERFEQALRLAERRQEPLAVLCLDLDRFKLVNDTLGHAAGDLLLQQVAARLRGTVRDIDVVARMGGDEFVILQANGPQPEAAQALAKRLVEVLGAPFDLDGQAASIGTSVGIALHPRDGSEPGELLANADVALYRAKSEGRGTLCFYEPSMDAQMREQHKLERELRAAIGTDQLELHYQPQFSCGDARAVIGFEALMRWTHPVRGRISPADFIPLAERTGLIIPLGLWALESACQTATGWPEGLRIAVNLSPAQFRNGALQAAVASVLAKTGLAAERLELEVTEGLLIGDTTPAIAALRALKALGVRVALDDFGTGYSSLSYLRLFPFDKLKIDRSFIQALHGDGDSGARAIVEAILAMSRSLGLEVTAEGVETPQQLAFLETLGCDAVQGFLLGRPMRAEDVLSWLPDQARRDAA